MSGLFNCWHYFDRKPSLIERANCELLIRLKRDSFKKDQQQSRQVNSTRSNPDLTFSIYFRLCRSFSRVSMSPFRYGFQADTANSKCRLVYLSNQQKPLSVLKGFEKRLFSRRVFEGFLRVNKFKKVLFLIKLLKFE